MRDLLFLRRPLARRTLVFCHVVAQLALIIGGLAWLARHSPLMTPGSWAELWPTLALGASIWLLTLVGIRLLAELMMLPHYLAGQRPGALPPSSVVTRAFDRRPAVHDPQSAWVNEAKPVDPDEGVLGEPRVTRPRQPLQPRRTEPAEPTLDLHDSASESSTETRRQEPSL